MYVYVRGRVVSDSHLRLSECNQVYDFKRASAGKIKRVAMLKYAHDSPCIMALAISPDGTKLFSSSLDGKIKVLSSVLCFLSPFFTFELL